MVPRRSGQTDPLSLDERADIDWPLRLDGGVLGRRQITHHVQ
jgi:hypothetical protein